MILSIAPRIVLIENTLTPSQCSEIINSALTFAESQIAGDDTVNPKVRSNYTHYDRENNFGYLRTLAIDLAEKHSPRKKSKYESEYISIQRYDTSQEYKQHYDFGENNNRIATAIFYLNDEFAGGDTFFERLSISVKPVTGSCLIFYYDIDNSTLRNLTSHGGNTVTQGTKYIATAWMKNNEPS